MGLSMGLWDISEGIDGVIRWCWRPLGKDGFIDMGFGAPVQAVASPYHRYRRPYSSSSGAEATMVLSRGSLCLLWSTGCDGSHGSHGGEDGEDLSTKGLPPASSSIMPLVRHIKVSSRVHPLGKGPRQNWCHML